MSGVSQQVKARHRNRVLKRANPKTLSRRAAGLEQSVSRGTIRKQSDTAQLMALPWVRLDSNIASHDKILALLAQRDGAKAFVLYVCALGYSGGHGTDGRIPKYALAVLHGTERLARLLIDVRLWQYNSDGEYVIRNWDTRQELIAITEGKRHAQSVGGRKAMCNRWHGPNCNCWRGSLGGVG